MTVDNLFGNCGIPIPGATGGVRRRHSSGGSAASSLSSGKASPHSLGGTGLPAPGFNPLLPPSLAGHPAVAAGLMGPLGGMCGLVQTQVFLQLGQDSVDSKASSSVLKGMNCSRYKTELCRPFEESGHCKYGEKCQFAHGMHEQRTLSRHPKYKTELCRTFHTIGFCPYGPRCHFIHNEDERKLGQLNQARQQMFLQQQSRLLLQLGAQAPPSPPHFFPSLPMSPAVSPTSGGLSPPFAFQAAARPGGTASLPIPVQQALKPKSLNFSNVPSSTTSSFPHALGSIADTPPSSLSGSPTSSPTMQLRDDALTPPPGFSGASLSPTRKDSGVADMAASLVSTEAATVLGEGLFQPPSSPVKAQDSPKSSGRLPIFSQIAGH